MESPPYVFVSSDSFDKAFVTRLIDFMETRGISVWHEELERVQASIPEGSEAQRNRILRNLASQVLRISAIVLPVFTGASVSKEGRMFSETNLAVKLNKPIISVLDENVTLTQLPPWVKNSKYYHYPSDKEELIRAIWEVIGTDPTSYKDQSSLKQTNTDPEFRELPEYLDSNNSERDDELQPLLEEDKTPFHKDNPSKEDYLGRRGLAEALATWINRLWAEHQAEAKSFIVNIHGQWGAGKTTFLYLLQNELQKSSNNQWIVVWFNAWENRHTKPEWWALLDRIYRDSVSQKKAMRERVWHIKLQEAWWRFYSGRKLELLGLLVSSLLLAFITYWATGPDSGTDQDFMQRIEGVAKPIGLVFSTLTTIFLGTRFVSQALIYSGSAKAAEFYSQFSPDPIDNIKQHFNNLIRNRIKKRVIVFIDDLDRCDRSYLVTLLETIQNLLNQQMVFYVIAADQRWLSTSFQENYKEFKESIKEPGKKLGYLFLEKIFQLSIPLPTLSEEVKAAYLGYLLGRKKPVEDKREQMMSKLVGVEDEQALIDKIQAEASGTIDKAIMRDVVVAKSASLEIERETVHYLNRFAHLMEPNPRGIKRYVIFYGVMRAIAILGGEDIVSNLQKRNQLVLWIIVRMRWPLLADYLEAYPQHLKNFASGQPSADIHPDVIDLVGDQEVRDVLTGKGIDAQLDEDALRRFLRLKATEKIF